jgi:endonuclease/exonuclease/phosphatase (EEP) superfamily protein YafD
MRALLWTARRLLVVAAMLYCAGLLVLALLWTIGVQGVWWLDLANVFALCLFAPLALLAPAALLSRRWALRSVVLVACAACLGLFGPQMIPPAAQAHSGPGFRVATFNLHYDLAESRLADIIAAIRAQQADVVALQELSPGAAAAIQKELVGNYPYQVLAPSTELTGMGLISRYPLVERQAQGAALQTALLRVGGNSVTVINVSMTAPEIKQRRLPVVRWVKYIRNYRTSKRSREIALLLRTIEGVQGPLVVAGDFNLSDREPDYAQLAARLHDSYRETSWGFGNTFPGSLDLGGVPISLPFLRIDYIWSADGVVPTATQVVCGSVSDHCMVVAEMQITDGAVDHHAAISAASGSRMPRKNCPVCEPSAMATCSGVPVATT